MNHPLDFPQQVKERVFDKQGSCLCAMNRPNVFRGTTVPDIAGSLRYIIIIICMMLMMKAREKKVTRAGRLSWLK